MKEINYSVLDPSGNITILVTSPVEPSERVAIADKLMSIENTAEQVGFVKVNDDMAILNMAGGEFCGNAVRCASYITKKNKVSCTGKVIECDGFKAYIPKDIGGIKHFIFDQMMDNPEEEIKKKKEYEAVGFMFFDEKNLSLKPLVYVRDADTLFWENSCASGTAVLATYLSDRDNKLVDLEIKEPGGKLRVKTSPKDPYVLLDGEIKLIKEGKINI